MKLSILNDEFFNSLDSSILPIEEADTLPPFCYTSDEFYEFEKEAVFNSEWLCVGRVSQVDKPGDYFTTSIVGEPLIITHDLKGELRAMSAVCRHRAMLVVEGSGNRRGFICRASMSEENNRHLYPTRRVHFYQYQLLVESRSGVLNSLWRICCQQALYLGTSQLFRSIWAPSCQE